jgi:hypothetical protein
VNQSACAKGRRSNCLIALGLRLLEVKRFCCGFTRGRRLPTEAALLPGYAALFTHERGVSVDLASKS